MADYESAGQCQVGTQDHRCPQPAYGFIAVGVIPTVHDTAQEPTRGVALLCRHHHATAPSNWDTPG